MANIKRLGITDWFLFDELLAVESCHIHALFYERLDNNKIQFKTKVSLQVLVGGLQSIIDHQFFGLC